MDLIELRNAQLQALIQELTSFAQEHVNYRMPAYGHESEEIVNAIEDVHKTLGDDLLNILEKYRVKQTVPPPVQSIRTPLIE